MISGQHLPKPLRGSATGEIIDPYVKIEVKGLACDTKDFKTKYISDNGTVNLLIFIRKYHTADIYLRLDTLLMSTNFSMQYFFKNIYKMMHSK